MRVKDSGVFKTSHFSGQSVSLPSLLSSRGRSRRWDMSSSQEINRESLRTTTGHGSSIESGSDEYSSRNEMVQDRVTHLQEWRMTCLFFLQITYVVDENLGTSMLKIVNISKSDKRWRIPETE